MRIHYFLFTALAAAIAWALPAAAEITGYTVAEGELRRVDLSTGDYETIGPTGIGHPSALGARLDYYFYGLRPEPDPPFPASLYRFDPATGAAERIGPVAALGGHWYLTSAAGALYSIDGEGTIYHVDETTAAATAIATIGSSSVFSLFGHGGALYLVDFQDWQVRCQLRRFDLAAQTLATIGPIGCADTAAIGDDGFVYLASVAGGVTLPGEPPWGGVEVWRYDFATGETTSFASWEPLPGKSPIFGLAAVEGGIAVDVPIAGRAGLLLLAAGLAAAALLLLPRR